MTFENDYELHVSLRKEDKYTSGLMLRRTPDRALKIRTVRPKSRRLATLKSRVYKINVANCFYKGGLFM